MAIHSRSSLIVGCLVLAGCVSTGPDNPAPVFEKRTPATLVQAHGLTHAHPDPHTHVEVISTPVDVVHKTSRFRWPTSGRVLHPFKFDKKGVDILGRTGQPIYAIEDGKVIYAGSGLTRYGNLVIIKHNEKMISAYAYNKQLFVHEGQVVKRGCKIAAMGQVHLYEREANRSQNTGLLHFEIRRNGKPIDPLPLLAKY